MEWIEAEEVGHLEGRLKEDRCRKMTLAQVFVFVSSSVGRKINRKDS